MSDANLALADLDPEEFDAAAESLERTVVVARPDAAEDPADDAERTIVVAKPAAADDDERTIVVERTSGAGNAPGARPTDGAASAPEASAPDLAVEPTRVSKRGAAARRQGHEPEAPLPAALRRRGVRRELRPAPLDPATLRPSVPGRGVGAVETYAPRPLPRRVDPPPAIAVDERPTRDHSAALPSMLRRSRRGAVAGLTVVAGTCVLSVAGLATVIVIALNGR